MKNQSKIFRSSYLNIYSPLTAKQKNINNSALILFLFLFSYLIFIRPLFLNYVSLKSLFQISFVLSLIPISVGWSYYYNLSKKINPVKWTFKNDIISLFKLFFSIAPICLLYLYCVVNFVYKQELEMYQWNFQKNIFLELLPYFVFITIILFVLMKFIDFLRYAIRLQEEFRINQEKVYDLKKVKNSNTDTIIFNGKNRDEVLEIKSQDFLFIESSGHYIKVYYRFSKKNYKTIILRNSIQNVLESLKNNNVFQCHRSYIINLDVPFKVEGNSKKAFLKMHGVDIMIPISRESYSRVVKHNDTGVQLVK